MTDTILFIAISFAFTCIGILALAAVWYLVKAMQIAKRLEQLAKTGDDSK